MSNIVFLGRSVRPIGRYNAAISSRSGIVLGRSVKHFRNLSSASGKGAIDDRSLGISPSSSGLGAASSDLILFDSLSGSYKPIRPPIRTSETNGGDAVSSSSSFIEQQHPKGLAWYTCGPTTYDSTHLGHARTYVLLDVMHRLLLQSSVKPLWIMNVTDVDDKILSRATEEMMDPIQLARKFEKEFWEDMDSLNVMRPDLVVRVTECVVEDIVPYIDRIVRNGMGYVLNEEEDGEDEGGSVYFDTRAFESKAGGWTKYGKLAPSTSASSEGEFFSWDSDEPEGVLKGPKKKDPRDFVLWKARKPGEELYWQSPWGEGRPGWHIECSAMIESVARKFQSTHDVLVHAGGCDLKFPHHTNEIAQAEAYHFENDDGHYSAKWEEGREEWIPHWVHTGHLHIEGRKMSKSLKNFITVRQVLLSDPSKKSSSLSSPADDFRLWCLGLSGSYRGPATYSETRLEEARVIREKIVRFLLDGEEWIRQSNRISGSQQRDSMGTFETPRRWGEEEYELFRLVHECSSRCRHAVFGSASLNGASQGLTGFDLDGSTYVKEMVKIADAGRSYLSAAEEGGRSLDAVRCAVATLRRHLSLVGFTDKTVKAGFVEVGDADSAAQTVVEGGERALAEELVRFRSAVRKAALADVEMGETSSGNIHEILSLCDSLRDRVLPPIGLEILDGKTDGGEGGTWRFCVPRHGSKEEEKKMSNTTRSPVPHPDVSVEDMFRVGQYKGMFCEFDDEGLPLLNSDGTEVSKRLRKKLLKKRDIRLKRLESKSNSSLR